MLKHMPSGPAVGQQQQQQQHQHQQPQQQQQQQHQQQQQQLPNQHQHSHLHPKHPPPPPPPQIQARGAAAIASRSIYNRSIQPLNVSTISHQTTAAGTIITPNKLIPNGHANGALRVPNTILNTTPLTSCSSIQNHCNLQVNTKHRIGAREALTSLGLLCLVSLLLALLSLIFLLKISPGGREPPPPPPPGPIASDDYIIVYDVTLALCALSLSLNLCCLLVCAIQFLFAVKLVRAPATPGRGNKFLQKSSVSRVCAVGGFFISIPIFLTGIILYTFTQFHSTPAIITSILIGIGIVFCGCAMVHNVFVWQKEKTICVRNQHPLNLNLTANQQQPHQQQTPISTISSPIHHHLYQNHNGIMSPSTHLHLVNHHHNNNNNPIHANHNHTPLTHTSQISHTTPVTPVTPLSANHSHVSFNHSTYLPNYGIRTATATPPTPKAHAMPNNNNNNNNSILIGRDVSGSVTPGTANGAGTLDLSNVTSTISPHELSTLV